MPSYTYSKDHTKLFTGHWMGVDKIVGATQALKSRKKVHFRIRTKHKIEPQGNKKRISWYMFSIRFTRKIKHSYKTTKKKPL